MSPASKLNRNEEVTFLNETQHDEHDETCLEVMSEAVRSEPGLAQVKLDTQQEVVSFEYDPRIISAPEFERIAERITPTLQQRFKTCTLRLGRQGGRACESCALMLENRVRQIEGVRRATASYRGGVISVSYDDALISPAQLAQQVRQLGAPLVAPDGLAPVEVRRPGPAPTLVKQSWMWLTNQPLEAIFTLVTLISMILAWLAETTALAAPAAVVLYSGAYVFGGWFGLKASLESLRQRTIDVDLLMVLAAVGAAIVGAPFEGAMLLFLFSLSNVLQDYALDRTRNAIRALMKLRPNQALIRRGDQLVTLPIEEIGVGDRFVVRPGDRIPLDGVVLEGESSVDQASITGESMPVTKRAGDALLAGTINQNGSLEARVTKLAQDSTLARLIKLVEEAQSEKAQTQRFLDKAEQYYAMGVIGFTLLAIVVPIFGFGEAFNPAFYRAMTLMVAASPCALIISTPASILAAIGNGARRGVLFKGGAYMEQAAGIKVVAFDKTGTLTEGHPAVTDVKVLPPAGPGQGRWQGSEDELLALAAAVEARSEHVLARATVEAAQQRRLEISEVAAFQAASGKGVRGMVNAMDIRVGNLRYFEEFNCAGLEAAIQEVERLQNEGKTSVVVAQIQIGAEGQTAYLLGVIAFADRLRSDAAEVVHELKQLGVERVVMLTGDHERIAGAIAAQAGVDEFYAGLLPEDKVQILKKLKREFGPVAMVGDGVNDAPALATASIGIAMGAAGTDVALETADVVLMADDLGNIPYVIALSRQTRRTLAINLGFALAMIILMVVAIFTLRLPLPLAVIGHEGGTVLVSLNGLRLLLYKRKRGSE